MKACPQPSKATSAGSCSQRLRHGWPKGEQHDPQARQEVRVRIYRAGKQEWVGSYAILREARKAEREALDRHDLGEETCAQFAERWPRDFPRGRASTVRTYEYDLKPFVAEFGKLKLGEINRRRAREWSLKHRSAHPTIRAMCNDALDEDPQLAATNPFAKLRLGQSRGRRDLAVLSEEELHDLANAALQVHGPYGPTVRACILFAAYVGCRPAELYMLKWSDISEGEVRIRENLGSTGEVTAPKNGRLRRVILPPPAREALREMPRRATSPYVFTTKTGRRFNKSSHYYYWNPARASYGRPEMDFYELRHFCATHLLELGVSHADVAVQLGHTDGGALVMSTYGHPSEDAARHRLLAAFDGSAPALRLIKPDQPVAAR